jgi:hypothetical protein
LHPAACSDLPSLSAETLSVRPSPLLNPYCVLPLPGVKRWALNPSDAGE